ncbi:DNA-binding transcription factor yap1 [Xylographa trunciseda]|nr:DNA-binding transcription factor yap1 [Xylographa trunciseda]
MAFDMSLALHDDSTFDADLYLSPKEQDLLLTALNSNKSGLAENKRSYPPMSANSVRPSGPRSTSNPLQYQPSGRNSLDNNDFHASPVQKTPGSGAIGVNESPFLDYDLDDGNFDWDINGDQMIGSLPGTSLDDDDDADLHDKRKISDDDADDNEGGGKRREGDDKTTKKPGRKPLTSEPTSKRKAQNRAAQRAFRERKERHLKELETKVEDLEKASESTNHENGLLRAQVDRLQTELKEYRKRLSVNPNAANRSPPQMTGQSMSSKSSWDISNNFQFEFPMFGTATDRSLSGYPSGTPPKRSTTNTSGLNLSLTPSLTRGSTNMSPRSNSGQGRTESQPKTGGQSRGSVDNLSDLFSPSILQTVSRSNSSDYVGFANNQRQNSDAADRTRASTSSNGASPSASSVSHNGVGSSCVTTPETFAESPEQRKASEAAFPSIQNGVLGRKSEGETTFCDQFAKACGTTANPVPLMMSESNETSASSIVKTPSDFQGIDWMAAQNGGAFDPVLFADYRDPQDNIMSGDFGAFFDEAFPALDFASPSATVLEPAVPKKRDLMQQIEDQQAGKEIEIVPGEGAKQFLTCNMLWDRVQRSERVQSGEADMDDLCTQLKAKAKCSGSGAVIDQKDVDAILGPAPEEHKDFLKMFK